MTKQTELLPIAAVAERMETTQLNVLMHIKRGLLKGEEIDGDWFVPAAAVDSYLKEKGAAAHGSLCKSHCKNGCASSCG